VGGVKTCGWGSRHVVGGVDRVGTHGWGSEHIIGGSEHLGRVKEPLCLML
jgi:hypothetical protein